MASTPALAAAKDFPLINVSELTAGYGIAYVFGVIGAVLFVQIILRKAGENSNRKDDSSQESCPAFSHSESLLWVLANIILGSIIDNVRIPGTGFSLGVSGRILTTGLLLGGLMRRFGRCCAQTTLQTVGSIGLIFFLAGMGMPAGFSFAGAAKPVYAVYGAMITLTPVTFGWFTARYVFSMSPPNSLAVICGGMTSTPAIGVLYGKSAKKCDMSAYAISYTGALFSLIMAVRLLHVIFT